MNEIVRYDLSTQNSGEWTTIAKVNEANQRGGVAFVVEDKVYAGLGEKVAVFVTASTSLRIA